MDAGSTSASSRGVATADAHRPTDGRRAAPPTAHRPGGAWRLVGRRIAPDDHDRGAGGDERYVGRGPLPAPAVEATNRVVNDSDASPSSGRRSRSTSSVKVRMPRSSAWPRSSPRWTSTRGRSASPPRAPPPVADGIAERPDGVGDVGAWIAMTGEGVANVSRALSWCRARMRPGGPGDRSFSRGPEMLELTWERVLTRPADPARRTAGLVAPGVLLVNVEPCCCWLRASSTALGATDPHRPGSPGRPRRRRTLWPARGLPHGERVGRAHASGRRDGGIPLDHGTLAATTDVRAEFGLNSTWPAR